MIGSISACFGIGCMNITRINTSKQNNIAALITLFCHWKCSFFILASSNSPSMSMSLSLIYFIEISCLRLWYRVMPSLNC